MLAAANGISPDEIAETPRQRRSRQASFHQRHQGKREIARRVKQIAKGQIRVTP
jgi:hypothetical protein